MKTASIGVRQLAPVEVSATTGNSPDLFGVSGVLPYYKANQQQGEVAERGASKEPETDKRYHQIVLASFFGEGVQRDDILRYCCMLRSSKDQRAKQLSA